MRQEFYLMSALEMLKTDIFTFSFRLRLRLRLYRRQLNRLHLNLKHNLRLFGSTLKIFKHTYFCSFLIEFFIVLQF